MRTFLAVFLVQLWMPFALAQVSTGIDVLEQQNFGPLKEIASRHGGHLRLAVVTNQIGIDAHERRTIDVLRKDAAAAVPRPDPGEAFQRRTWHQRNAEQP